MPQSLRARLKTLLCSARLWSCVCDQTPERAPTPKLHKTLPPPTFSPAPSSMDQLVLVPDGSAPQVRADGAAALCTNLKEATGKEQLVPFHRKTDCRLQS